MSLEITDLDYLVHSLIVLAEASNFDLQGPVEIEYGWGWAPTFSFWYGDRRVHFYYNLTEHVNKVTVEVADIKSTSATARGLIQTIDDAWNIVDQFLKQRCTIEDLPDYHWKVDSLNHDKFIPHPPNAPNPANIVELISKGEPWQPPKERRSDSLLSRLVNLLKRNVS